MATVARRRLNLVSRGSGSADRYEKMPSYDRHMMRFLDETRRTIRRMLSRRARIAEANTPQPDPMTFDVWEPVADYNLTESDLTHLHVRLQATPLALDQASPLVQPIPLSDMTAWLEESHPWTKRGWGGVNGEFRHHSAFQNASGLCNDLRAYMHLPQIDTPDCRSVGMHTEYGQRLGRSWVAKCYHTFWYEVDNFHQYRDTTRHAAISCMLAQNTVLDDDYLTVTELAAVYNLTVLRTQDGVLKTIKCIPLTIVSFGASKGRVVHGHVDPDSHTIYLAKSRVMDFSQEGAFAHDEWKHLLCWLYATPIDKQATESG